MSMKEKYKPKKVGIIGCGAIATLIVKAVEQKQVICDEIILFDKDTKKAEKLQNSLRFPATLVRDVEKMLFLKPVVIVEAASQQAARDYAGRITSEGVDLIVMSTDKILVEILENGSETCYTCHDCL